MACLVLNKIILPIKPNNTVSNRSLFYWLTVLFNRVDHDRIKQVGPDRACAEWLLRNGASVKFKTAKQYLAHYNELPHEEIPLYIQAVDATGSAICDVGFPHFEGCKFIDEVKLVNCKYINDGALPLLSILKESLKNLEVSNCKSVTDKGLLSLQELKNLKVLKIDKLPYLTNKIEVESKLRDALPGCDIQFK